MSAVSIATRGVIVPSATASGPADSVEEPIMSVVELSPSVYSGLNLQPETVSAEEQDDSVVPEMTSADDLAPETSASIELVPVMISAEEE